MDLAIRAIEGDRRPRPRPRYSRSLFDAIRVSFEPKPCPKLSNMVHPRAASAIRLRRALNCWTPDRDEQSEEDLHSRIPTPMRRIVNQVNAYRVFGRPNGLSGRDSNSPCTSQDTDVGAHVVLIVFKEVARCGYRDVENLNGRLTPVCRRGSTAVLAGARRSYASPAPGVQAGRRSYR
jgi:hypothetical protein